MPAPVRVLVGRIVAAALTSRTCAIYASTSASRKGTKSILSSSTTSLERNVAGYISGLSLPSVTEETIALALTDVELRRTHQLGRG